MSGEGIYFGGADDLEGEAVRCGPILERCVKALQKLLDECEEETGYRVDRLILLDDSSADTGRVVAVGLGMRIVAQGVH